VVVYRKNGINPLLISIVTNKDLSEIPPSPPESMLPGVYAKQVCKNLGSMRKALPERKHKLTCVACGRNGQYNLGLMAFDLAKYLSFSKGNDKSDQSAWASSIQFSGYFRCHYCNSGCWQLPNQTKTMLQIAVMGHALALKAKIKKEEEIVVGRFTTFDGESFFWATEVEEHFLHKLSKEPDNAWIWDRLGNIYIKGGRLDLAVVAFEESIKQDPCQMESHYSLGKILLEAGAKDAATLHLRRVLLTARDYDHLTPLAMRDLLTDALFMLFDILSDLNKLVEFIPKGNEFSNESPESCHDQKPVTVHFMDIDISVDEFEGMYPLAELYMGKHQKKLAPDVQTLYPTQSNTNKLMKEIKKKSSKKKRKRKK